MDEEEGLEEKPWINDSVVREVFIPVSFEEVDIAIVFEGSSDEFAGTKSVNRISSVPKGFVKVVKLENTGFIELFRQEIILFFFLDNFRIVSSKILKEDDKQTNATNILHKLTFTDLRELDISDFESIINLCGVSNGRKRSEQK